MLPSKLRLALAGLLLAGGPLGAMTITVSPDPPPLADVLAARDLSIDVGSYLCTHGIGGAIDIGQTFQLANDAVLERVTLKVRPMSDETTGELVTLRIGTFDGPFRRIDERDPPGGDPGPPAGDPRR